MKSKVVKNKKKEGKVSFAKRRPGIFWSIFVVGLIFTLIAGLVAVVTVINTLTLNDALKNLFEKCKPDTESSTELIVEIDTFIEEAYFLVNFHEQEYENFKEENHKFVVARANMISQGISNLEEYRQIGSRDVYDETIERIRTLKIDDATVFGEKVKAEVDNYDDLLKYEENFYELAESYKVKCDKCIGTGKVKCSYCDGTGKRIVTWYSEGDHGDVSYTSYDCKYCSSGRVDCSCQGGYFLKFD